MLAPAFPKADRPVALHFRAFIAAVLIAAMVLLARDYYRMSRLYLPHEEGSLSYPREGFFANPAQFAMLVRTTVTQDNAAAVHTTALQLLHYTPEPRVIEKVIASALLLGLEDEAALHTARYRAAFPVEAQGFFGVRRNTD